MPAYVRSGAEISVNTQMAGDQLRSSMTRLADGSLVLVWQTGNTSQDGSGAAVMLRRFSASGVALGAEMVVNTNTTGDQTRPQVTALASGGYVVSWETADTTRDGNGSAIMGRIYDSTGIAVGADFRANTLTTADQRQPTVAALADGSFVMIWHTTDATLDGQGWSLRGQRFAANGALLGAEFRVNTSAFGSQNNADVAVLADGRFVVSWQHGASGSSEVNAQVYNADGTAQGGQISLPLAFAGNFDSSVAALGDGGFVISYFRGGAVWFQRFDVNRLAVGGEQYVGAGLLPEVSALTEGGFVIAWRGDSQTTLARAFSATGAATSSAFTLATGGNSGVEASIVNLVGGGFAASWTAGFSGFETGQDIRLGIFQPQVNTAPELGAATRSVSVAENGTFITTIVATDDGGPSAISYSIIGGADAARFAISATSGVLSFIAAANFEAPTDVGANNVYDVIVQASDGALADTQAIAVAVTNVNEAPVITSNGAGASASVNVSESGIFATTVTASDPENATLTYSISGGLDAALFAINSATGVLSFVTAPNFEAPTDNGFNNVYDVVVRVSDGVLADAQALALTITNMNEVPVIVSNGGGTTGSAALFEGQLSVATVSATDPENAVIAYSITGGADAALFAIDALTGALGFIAAPDFETGGDNLYNVIVSASDGINTDTQALSISVANVNEGVSITSGTNFAVAENGTAVTTVTATDVDGDAVSFSIAGGADAALFAINATTGALSFLAAPNFEAPGDANGDNVYDVTITATDGALSDTRALSIGVGNTNEGVTITSGSTFAVAENGVGVATVAATDTDGDAVSYSIAGGADAALFTIDTATGALSFVAAPNFEAPGDVGGDNVYDVTVAASDGALSDTRALAVTVSNANEAIAIISGSAFAVAENATVVTTVTASDIDGDVPVYSIAGGADAALFTIDAATGSLSFIAAPDFEAAADAGGDNIYDVTVSASDGVFVDTRAIAVSVVNTDEGVAITSNGGGATAAITVSENSVAVATVAAIDVDGDTVTYSIDGGSDASLFIIDQATGVLNFAATPNFEAPGDSDGNNIYDVIVRASSGAFSDTQALSVSVGNVNEGVAITSSGGGNTAALTVMENATAVAAIVAIDTDGGAITYAIVGGSDAASFAIDANTGALRFIAAPNHEAPTDAGGNNVYDVVVTATDGVFTDTQALAVTVADAREGNTITGNNSANTISLTASPTGQPRATDLEDTINGLGGNDNIQAAGGEDIVDGGTGNDTINGGAGADVLTGGTGADRFVFSLTSDSAVGAADIITDFNRSQTDRIDLSAIDARTAQSGNQAFAFIGSAAFSNVAGQLRFEQINGNTFVTGDVNGDGVADFGIQVSGLVSLVASDFVL